MVKLATLIGCARLLIVTSIVGVVVSNSCADETRSNDKVLRHAVFFKFKDDTGKTGAASVVDAFSALPAKIDTIADYEWGETINKDRNDGFTHAFFLTFNDEEGRAAYLPHPEHKAFGNVLRPHLDKVFVVDYWGRAQKVRGNKELKHAVFFKFKDDVSREDIKVVEDGLAALPGKIEEIKEFEWGTNNSPEKHDQGFTHCFMFTFDSEKALKAYAEDPAHVAVANDLKPKIEKVRVLDFWVNPGGKRTTGDARE